MSLSSEGIQKKEFHIVFKGYKPAEVDKFLDKLAQEFDGMQRKVRDLEEKMDSIKYEGDSESSKMKKVIQEALISAHSMAAEIKQKAKIEVGELVSKKKMEQEQEIKVLQNEKLSLESSILKLKDDYSSFIEQISRFADDFKEKTMNIGDERLLDALKVPDEDAKKSSSERSGKLGSTKGKASPQKSDEPDSGVKEKVQASPQKSDEPDSGVKEKVLYKHASKEEKKDLGANDLKDLAALTDEMLEKLEHKDGKEGLRNSKQPQKEIKEESEEEKRNRKKIDIANPDIINDFFNTDEG